MYPCATGIVISFRRPLVAGHAARYQFAVDSSGEEQFRRVGYFTRDIGQWIIPRHNQTTLLPQLDDGVLVFGLIEVDGKSIGLTDDHVLGSWSAQLDFDKEELVIVGIDDIVLDARPAEVGLAGAQLGGTLAIISFQ